MWSPKSGFGLIELCVLRPSAWTEGYSCGAGDSQRITEFPSIQRHEALGDVHLSQLFCFWFLELYCQLWLRASVSCKTHHRIREGRESWTAQNNIYRQQRRRIFRTSKEPYWKKNYQKITSGGSEREADKGIQALRRRGTVSLWTATLPQTGLNRLAGQGKQAHKKQLTSL